VVVKTKDNRLKLTFDFLFRKAYPSVLVTPKIANISSVKLFDIDIADSLCRLNLFTSAANKHFCGLLGTVYVN